MKLIEREIMSRVQKCNDESYKITVPDVMNAVTHLKDGKSDGYEGLSSDHFIHGNRQLYVLLSILFTLFLRHGFSPDSMILGTMIPIPKDKKKSLCSSSNYRAIALSSIVSKILDWIILIKEEYSLCSSELHLDLKRDYLQRNAPLVCWKLLIIIMLISLVCAHYNWMQAKLLIGLITVSYLLNY